jgi:hypothetical protein
MMILVGNCDMEILFLEEKGSAFCLNNIHLLVPVHATIFHSL